MVIPCWFVMVIPLISPFVSCTTSLYVLFGKYGSSHHSFMIRCLWSIGVLEAFELVDDSFGVVSLPLKPIWWLCVSPSFPLTSPSSGSGGIGVSLLVPPSIFGVDGLVVGGV